jgi:hypothetical protein
MMNIEAAVNSDVLANSAAPTTEVNASASEFATYLRELPRLLAEGHADRYALIKGEQVVSIWDTQRDVLQAGYERFGLDQFCVKKIDARDPERIAALQAKEAGTCRP